MQREKGVKMKRKKKLARDTKLKEEYKLIKILLLDFIVVVFNKSILNLHFT